MNGREDGSFFHSSFLLISRTFCISPAQPGPIRPLRRIPHAVERCSPGPLGVYRTVCPRSAGPFGGFVMGISVCGRLPCACFSGLLLLGVGLLASGADEPSKTEASLRTARAARRADRYAEAERQLESFRLLGGDREVAQAEKAMMRAQQGDVAPVEKLLNGFLEKKGRPETPFVLEALTRGFLEDLQFD